MLPNGVVFGCGGGLLTTNEDDEQEEGGRRESRKQEEEAEQGRGRAPGEPHNHFEILYVIVFQFRTLVR